MDQSELAQTDTASVVSTFNVFPLVEPSVRYCADEILKRDQLKALGTVIAFIGMVTPWDFRSSLEK